MILVAILGIAQDGGVPQAGCSCERCMDVHNGNSKELFPVALGITDDDGKYHLIEASRSLARQLRLWSNSISKFVGEVPEIISDISSVTLTHHHLGHIDGLGLFGREVMGKPGKSIRLVSGKAVIDMLEKKSVLGPFIPEIISNGSKVNIGKGVNLEFSRVPHRECEHGETYGIIIRGKYRSLFFLPDHDSYDETLKLHNKSSIREWLESLSVDIVFLDGTFFTIEEIAVRRIDSKGIPHPPILESLSLLGEKRNDDPDIIFTHLNHTNSVLNNKMSRLTIEKLGWKVGQQGEVFTL